MKKAFRIFLACILILATLLSMVACNEDTQGSQTPDGDDQGSQGEVGGKDPTPVMCTVSYENSSLQKQSVEKGTAISQPANPEKADSVFVGWYMDADYTTKAAFPLTVNSDTKLYACFYSYREAFQKARENTIGDNVPGFEYSHNMTISATALGVAVTGNTVGNAKYSNIGEVNFYDESTNSGLLLFDGSSYKIRRGSSLQSLSLDENGRMKSFAVEQVDSNYKYDSSSLAKAVFTCTDDQIRSISATSQKNVYKLNTDKNFSSVLSTIVNYINHPMVEKLLTELPESSAETSLYVSFNGDKIDSYTYEFKVAVSQLQFDLKYTLKFTDSGVAKNIVTKNFSNVALSAADIKRMKDEASSIVNLFRGQKSSGYNFQVDTGVDFSATSSEINATFKGSAYRNIQGSTVFFHNDIDIDSDYKNSDLYKDQQINDVHVKLTKLSNGEVHLIEKKLLADSTNKVDDFVAGDSTSFYLFDVLTHSGEYSFAEKITENGATVYTFGLTNSGVAALLTWLNSSLDLDPLDKATVDALVFGNFDASSVLLNAGTVSVVVKNGALAEINVNIEGDFNTRFAGSVAFATAKDAQLKLDMNITVNTDGSSFKPFDTVKDAK